MLHLAHKHTQAWQLSIELVKEVYTLTGKFPEQENFSLTSQVRRSALSIASNIAEGSSRTTKAEKRRFYEIARSSLAELDTQLIIAVKLEYMSEDDYIAFSASAKSIFSLLSVMMKTPR